MDWKQTLAGGSATGVVLATLVSLIMIMGGLEPPSAGAAIAVFIGMIFLSAYSVKKISQSMGWFDPSLKVLIPVSTMTFILPLLGATFGAPNSDFTTLAFLVLLGLLGGIFWSLPIAGWAYYSSTRDPQ
ncbi:MAG: hypothetical protein CMB33_03905 [Euryarchaeota archaeon]|nr:hypothetical protein [Euryarchaeota archaeon]